MNVVKMSDKQKEDALEFLILLKEKWDRDVKGRACTYGQK